MLVICGDGVGAAKKNLEVWGGKNVWWQQTNFGVCKKFVGVGVTKNFWAAKKIVGDRAGKKLCGQKTEKFWGIVKKFVGRTGGGKILGIQWVAQNFGWGTAGKVEKITKIEAWLTFRHGYQTPLCNSYTA